MLQPLIIIIHVNAFLIGEKETQKKTKKYIKMLKLTGGDSKI